jgi:hypothetical protein
MMTRWLDLGERPRRAEYVMVLVGDENTRPFTAAALIKAGFARRVLVTEVAALPEVSDLILPPRHEVNRQVLVKRGVATGDITILPATAGWSTGWRRAADWR